MTWDRDIGDAYRLIEAAKESGADVCKFQWTSSAKKLQERRGVDRKYAGIYERGVQYPAEWLEKLRLHCDQVGIEFSCTTYLIEDIPIVAPLVKRFKVSAYESQWAEFMDAHAPFGREIIASTNPKKYPQFNAGSVRVLHCISEYPTPIEHLGLRIFSEDMHDGLSDHTTSLITGALAVAAGASIVEKHIRLGDADPKNPDYDVSLPCDDMYKFHHYVWCIRQAEKAL